MQIRSIKVAGYRPFSPVIMGLDEALQAVELAPLTLIFGRNSSGKSALARLTHVVLAGLQSASPLALPTRRDDRRFAPDFRHYLHGYQPTNPLALLVNLRETDGAITPLRLTLLHASAKQPDGPTRVLARVFGEHREAGLTQTVAGLLPDRPEAEPWRRWAEATWQNSVWLGPVRAEIQPRYEARSLATRLDDRGADAPYRLHGSPELATKVSRWFETHLHAGRVRVDSTLDSFVLRLGQANLADAGEGHQQLLPVLVHLFERQAEAKRSQDIPGFIDVIEQPELHLHPSAHGPVADLLIAARRPGSSLVVETHSEDLLLRVRRRIAEGKLSPDDVALHYVESGLEEGAASDERSASGFQGSRVRKICVDRRGEVDWWPKGVFSESFEEVKAIRRAQRTYDAIAPPDEERG